MKPAGAPHGCWGVCSCRGRGEGGTVSHCCIMWVDLVVILDRQRCSALAAAGPAWGTPARCLLAITCTIWQVLAETLVAPLLAEVQERPCPGQLEAHGHCQLVSAQGISHRHGRPNPAGAAEVSAHGEAQAPAIHFACDGLPCVHRVANELMTCLRLQCCQPA